MSENLWSFKSVRTILRQRWS